MSHTYSILCVDCGVVLELGKIVNVNEDGHQVDWMLTGWLDQDLGQRITDEYLGEVIKRMLILHRGHEIRVVPDEYLQLLDPDERLTYIDSASEILGVKIDFEPDGFLDTEELMKDRKLNLKLKNLIDTKVK